MSAPILYLLPALVVFALLVLGRHPGEDAVTRMLERARVTRRQVRPPSLVAAAPDAEPARLSGGRLIARALAGRAPPRGALAHAIAI